VVFLNANDSWLTVDIWRMGDTGEILDGNEQGCASLGYSREALRRMTVFDFAPVSLTMKPALKISPFPLWQPTGWRGP
jgi:hypothetical protein